MYEGQSIIFAMPNSSRATRSTVRSALLPTGMPTFVLTAFQGPIDLLLQLIKANEVDIADIPIAEITTQYLSLLEQMEALDLAVAGEYLVMAATLIEIKSRMLLPPTISEVEDEPDDPRLELVQRLREYQQFHEALDLLREREEAQRALFVREPLLNCVILPCAVPAQPLSSTLLLGALNRLLSEVDIADQPLTTVVPRRRATLRLKMAEVLHRIEASMHTGGARFSDLFELPCMRYDIVITFLAMLELLRLQRIEVQQDLLFGDIILRQL